MWIVWTRILGYAPAQGCSGLCLWPACARFVARCSSQHSQHQSSPLALRCLCHHQRSQSNACRGLDSQSHSQLIRQTLACMEDRCTRRASETGTLLRKEETFSQDELVQRTLAHPLLPLPTTPIPTHHPRFGATPSHAIFIHHSPSTSPSVSFSSVLSPMRRHELQRQLGARP